MKFQRLPVPFAKAIDREYISVRARCGPEHLMSSQTCYLLKLVPKRPESSKKLAADGCLAYLVSRLRLVRYRD
ncbi:hypothetical protein C4D60_Mb01t29770 [Musa balbisiana]|uniref:Uncharacterized protein n=1 Tax=Musa balbisiana TaxID=52838 RepID=A0A4S8JRR6_MUSBA|nr:hypothetical protein C4D60_Mb01t29770 [Musa balbisiana]